MRFSKANKLRWRKQEVTDVGKIASICSVARIRGDLARIDVPTLVIHGDADRIVPITAAGLRTAKLVKGARLLVVKDGPHCISWTHAEEVNAELLSFLGGKAGKSQPEAAQAISS